MIIPALYQILDEVYMLRGRACATKCISCSFIAQFCILTTRDMYVVLGQISPAAWILVTFLYYRSCAIENNYGESCDPKVAYIYPEIVFQHIRPS